jgi:antitoxin (DNA-binding transcriptional repressor) of toxin-antitoxin stability system
VETEKIGMREFRENLAGYLESGKPLAITRHGETLGFYIPAQKRTGRSESVVREFLRSVAPG